MRKILRGSGKLLRMRNSLARLLACPTPHGCTVNCAPVHRYSVGFLPEIGVPKDFVNEIPLDADSCIVMQMRRTYQGLSSGFSPGKCAGNDLYAPESR